MKAAVPVTLPHRPAAATAVALLTALVAIPAQAGRTCEPETPTAETVSRSMTLAEHVAAALDASGARVAVVARAGQNLDAYGLTFSHLGFVYRDEGADRRPVWRVVHKLNDCGTAHAAVWRQGLGEFFLGNLHDWRAGIVVPSPEVQAKLLPVLRDNARATWLNEPSYNMLAYPWATRYQQSNQWAIETLAMSQDMAASPSAVPSRERAQAWLKLQGYTPGVLTIGAMKRLGARTTRANIAFDDHPNEKRFADRIETVTVDSVFGWLGRSGLGGPVTFVR